MGLRSDLHRIPGNFLEAPAEWKLRRKLARIFVHLDHVPTRIVDQQLAGSRGIVSLVFKIEPAEAPVRGRTEPVLQSLPAVRFATPFGFNCGGTLRVEHRLDFGSEAAIPFKAGKRFERAVPCLPVSTN